MMLEANWSSGKFIQFAGRIQRMSDFDNLAKLIKLAAKTREESWDSKGYGNYKLSLDEACDKAGKELNLEEQHTRLANLMLFSFWNDALDWADKQVYPIEMAYVEACYRFINRLYEENFSDLTMDQTKELISGFSNAAQEARKSLYGF